MFPLPCLRVGFVCLAVIFFPFHLPEHAITDPWKESGGGLHVFKLLLLLQFHQLTDTDSDFIWNFPGLDFLENEQFVLETVTGVAFHLTVLAEHDFSAGSTQDTTLNVYRLLCQRAINKI